jgi:hypothetical protein
MQNRSFAGRSRVCPERKFAVESLCAADVAIGSLEVRLRHRREAVGAVSCETADLKGFVTSKIARERTLGRLTGRTGHLNCTYAYPVPSLPGQGSTDYP